MSAVEVHAIVSGRADGPTVVLSNSLGSDHRMWDAQVPELEKRFRVVRYDTRGHGSSPVPAGPYALDDLADDLIALLDRLDIDTCHLVGLSLGGMTAMRVAARNPERIDRLGLLCTAAALPPASVYTERAALVREQGTGVVAEGVVSRWFTPDFLERNPGVRRKHEEMVATTPDEGYAACCEVIAALDVRDDLASIKAPTLAIAGGDDLATPPAKLAEIADNIRDARLLVVPHSAHLAPAQQPQIITPALIEHLEAS
ncbi:3-oxoadipate enol-lactonase [Aldersonia kunmingensis]|uniref:3-oxoadipate enol-lactonase n=1 Tax=Aldersonia kunmingensis TaxID=408066 RepID=UPI000835177B|nr:3-oxoadipate enol-lactonase [Aldersonia kunmingensis]